MMIVSPFAVLHDLRFQLRVNHGTAVNAYMNALFLDEGRDPDVRIKLDVDTVSAWV